MEKSHAAVWGLDAPTPDQLKELFAQVSSGRVTKGQLQDLLIGKVVSGLSFPTWKTIKLGTHKTVDELHKALTDSGCRVSDWAGELLKKITVCPVEAELDLVVVSVAELGFKDGATRRDIYRRAQELGLDLCPPEVGPQLRLQYKDQPMREWLLVAMEPIANSHAYPYVFGVDPDVGLWPGALDGYPDYFWDGYDRWVFRCRK